MKKPSELFEGTNSDLYKTWKKATTKSAKIVKDDKEYSFIRKVITWRTSQNVFTIPADLNNLVLPQELYQVTIKKIGMGSKRERK